MILRCDFSEDLESFSLLKSDHVCHKLSHMFDPKRSLQGGFTKICAFKHFDSLGFKVWLESLATSTDAQLKPAG